MQMTAMLFACGDCQESPLYLDMTSTQCEMVSRPEACLGLIYESILVPLKLPAGSLLPLRRPNREVVRYQDDPAYKEQLY